MNGNMKHFIRGLSIRQAQKLKFAHACIVMLTCGDLAGFFRALKLSLDKGKRQPLILHP